MIKFIGLSKEYKLGSNSLLALKNISFKINTGEFVSIMGSSGSGKSTMMNIIGCLDLPTAGQYILNSKDVSKLNSNELANIRNKDIGFVFQNFNLLPRLNALENVILPLLYSGQAPKERINLAKQSLASVGLEERIMHRPNQLSGGQQQRVSIARAIVSSPKIILADEPTGAIDSNTSLEIMEILKSLNKKGITIIIVTHETDISKFAKRILYMKDGEIIKDES
ncbi:MAG: ABC transporter ATP-binding protein [Flavobacteriales bacterium]|jgi:putative ABC transport system ATP-binding protein|nr:ABC transporter ATP-binding protein [Flavobacteriales bacterium]